MMYENKMVVAIKHNGQVLREIDDTVYLPFGSEYSIYMKNLNTVRASAQVSVDGKDLGGGSRFIVHPNGGVNLERFVHHGNLEQGNRLKFIERTSDIEKSRGIQVEDGLVRVEFVFEKIVPIFCSNISTSTTYDTNASPVNYTCDIRSSERGIVDNSCREVRCCNTGITVPGSMSNQRFHVVDDFPTEDQHYVIILKLLGETNQRRVEQPVTVKTKAICSTCKHVNKATAKYCSKCGTSLTII